MQVAIKTKYVPLGEYNLECRGRYHDGSPALQLFGDTGRMLTATVCLDHAPRPGHVMIKDWSENEGVLDALIGAGIIGKPVSEVPTGFVKAYECPLTQAAKSALNL